MKRKGPWKILLALPLILAICFYSAYKVLRPGPSPRAMRVAQLKKSIQAELPAKATKAQIQSWFQRQKISFGYTDAKKTNLNDESFVVESGIPVKNIGGILSGWFAIPSEELFEDNCSINIAFFLDKNNKLIKHQVGWSCSGL